VSSHALDQQRTAGVHFKVAGYTNLSRDHLDYHKTLETYFEAKARLFSDGLRKSRARGRMAVVNIDDERGSELVERWGGKALRVSLDPDADAEVKVLEAEYGLLGTKARILTSKGEWDIETTLIGPYNLANTCLAVGLALAMGFSKARILKGLSVLERVPGRMERIPDEQERTVLVDYAHSPDALEKVLSALKPHCTGRLVVVFGAGGERDAEKREPMGRAVAAAADQVLITNDNPRGEDPNDIAAALADGLRAEGLEQGATLGAVERGFAVELDRQSAIHQAVDFIEPGDVLLIAGKGHEATQVIGDRRYRFDDREVARRALEGLPADDIEEDIRPEDVVEVSEDVEGAVADGEDVAQPKEDT
ncbi:MAG: UDP-N-acetylmuramoyl-L-alanyl-D-glutamate--2,6-diaminopimelate ligase, partial [Myxococcota bacterium]